MKDKILNDIDRRMRDVFAQSPAADLEKNVRALISSFLALVVTDLFTDGLNIDGIGTWVGSTVVVWLASVLAVFILPFLGLKKYLEARRD